MKISKRLFINFEKLYVFHPRKISSEFNSLQITTTDRDHHLKLSALDNETQRLKLKHKEDLKDQESTSSREIQRLKESFIATEQNLKEQITKLENIRTTLERVRHF